MQQTLYRAGPKGEKLSVTKTRREREREKREEREREREGGGRGVLGTPNGEKGAEGR